jgi:hypothetical protein
VKIVNESIASDIIALSPKKDDVGLDFGTSLGHHDKQDMWIILYSMMILGMS